MSSAQITQQVGESAILQCVDQLEVAGELCSVLQQAHKEVMNMMRMSYPVSQMEEEEKKVDPTKLKKSDFIIHGQLGKGSYGKVYLVEL